MVDSDGIDFHLVSMYQVKFSSRKLHEALDGLEGVFCIADDIVVAGVGATMEEANKSHDARLQALLQRCKEKKIALNEQKFVLRRHEIVFMGHQISAAGISIDPARIKAIMDMPNRQDLTSARRFLGIVQFLARFVPNMTSIVKPIQDLINPQVVWYWGEEHTRAVQKVKALICEVPVLAHFDADEAIGDPVRCRQEMVWEVFSCRRTTQ